MKNRVLPWWLGPAAMATLIASPAAWAADALPTLNGQPPMVIGHRGLPGLMPEETQPAFELAADLGTDALEEDLHLTKDCVLVARHNPWLSDNTDAAEVARSNPTVMSRKRVPPGVMVKVAWPQTATSGPSTYLSDLTDPHNPKSVLKSLIVDGEDHTGDWSITDFTLPELKQWFGGTTYDAAAERPKIYNGKFPILSFQEIIDIAKAKSKQTGRIIAVYPESKNPTWNDAQAIANGCGQPGSHPLEDAMIKIIENNGLNAKTAPIFVQSFEPGSLKYLVAHGLKTKVVQLIDGYDVDLKNGGVVYNEITDSRPFDWTLSGDSRWFDVMLTPAGLGEIKTYADGIGPWKPQIVPLKIVPWTDKNPDGSAFTGSTAQATTQPATSLIADAHRAGLFVHAFTFRNEKKYLAASYAGDPQRGVRDVLPPGPRWRVHGLHQCRRGGPDELHARHGQVTGFAYRTPPRAAIARRVSAAAIQALARRPERWMAWLRSP